MITSPQVLLKRLPKAIIAGQIGGRATIKTAVTHPLATLKQLPMTAEALAFSLNPQSRINFKKALMSAFKTLETSTKVNFRAELKNLGTKESEGLLREFVELKKIVGEAVKAATPQKLTLAQDKIKNLSPKAVQVLQNTLNSSKKEIYREFGQKMGALPPSLGAQVNQLMTNPKKALAPSFSSFDNTLKELETLLKPKNPFDLRHTFFEPKELKELESAFNMGNLMQTFIKKLF